MVRECPPFGLEFQELPTFIKFPYYLTNKYCQVGVWGRSITSPFSTKLLSNLETGSGVQPDGGKSVIIIDKADSREQGLNLWQQLVSYIAP